MVRRLETAVLLAIGTELTTGATRDTNGGDLAAELTALGVAVARLTALPDDLDATIAAVRAGLEEADLVVTTGGLGPTPDDLTREAIAGALGEVPAVDAEQALALQRTFARRGLPMPAANSKQAWLIPGAAGLPNPNGTAPGWWVDAPDGRVVVALPGPPREMRPMWRDHVMPRLRAIGLGADRAEVVLRLTGVGESALVDLIGEATLRASNPIVATYAREDAVDVRISAAAAGGRSARALVRAAEARLTVPLGRFIFARGSETWVDALDRRLAGRSLATVESGSGGTLAALLGTAPWLVRAEVLHDLAGDLRTAADTARLAAGADLGLAVRVRPRGPDLAVGIGLALPGGRRRVTRMAFVGGEAGRRRAAVIAAAELWRALGPAG
ncbi:MAG TPA: molybdopterin-binding protein [Candidatus Sulfotelmatobacter sp.]|nr:molybdopterin-binding protein [Candidatus Sulfotelmatobacter sp.]